MYRGPEMMAFANEKKSGNIQPEIRKIKEKIHGNLILSPESPVILEITCKGQTVTAMGGEYSLLKISQWKNTGSVSRWRNWEIQIFSGGSEH